MAVPVKFKSPRPRKYVKDICLSVTSHPFEIKLWTTGTNADIPRRQYIAERATRKDGVRNFGFKVKTPQPMAVSDACKNNQLGLSCNFECLEILTSTE